ncbi:hypothetical protein ACFSLT_11380 [Novosphingobium resinovorum]
MISGSIRLVVVSNQSERQDGLLIAEGSFDRATNTVSGTLTDKTNGYSGTFKGRMYGPDRAELGVVFQFSRDSDGSRYFGHFIGTR